MAYKLRYLLKKMTKFNILPNQERHMTLPTKNSEYPKLPGNTSIPGQKNCLKNFEKEEKSISDNENITFFQRYRDLSSSKNKKTLESRYLLRTSAETREKTISAYQNTLKSYARWASPMGQQIKQL